MHLWGCSLVELRCSLGAEKIPSLNKRVKRKTFKVRLTCVITSERVFHSTVRTSSKKSVLSNYRIFTSSHTDVDDDVPFAALYWIRCYREKELSGMEQLNTFQLLQLYLAKPANGEPITDGHLAEAFRFLHERHVDFIEVISIIFIKNLTWTGMIVPIVRFLRKVGIFPYSSPKLAKKKHRLFWRFPPILLNANFKL